MAAVTLFYIWPATGATPPTASQVFDSMTVDLSVAADGDTVATIPNLLGVISEVVVQQITSQALTALSAWAVTTNDGTNVVLTKLASTGSAGARQARVFIKRPHSIGR